MKSELDPCVFSTDIRESELEGIADSVAEAKPKLFFILISVIYFHCI